MIGKTVDQLSTPALLIDLDIVERNIARAAALARASGKKLRPHIKTHKLPLLAHWQMRAGAVGICAAKVSEAEVMADGGIRDILIANEVVGEDKLQRLAALARRVRLTVLVDSPRGIDALGEAARQYDASFDVMLEIDTGDARCGASPAQAAALARRIADTPRLRFGGIETFGGSVYHCGSLAEEERLAPQVAGIMREVKAAVEGEGLPVAEVSVGGTPALEILAREPLYTELRPGVYIFNDAATVSRQGAAFADCAATVLATVISRPTPRRMVVDGGGKTFSYCRPGVVFGRRILHGVLKDRPDICLSSLSEEHGVFETDAELPPYRVGDKLQVIPAHVCPVVNLFDSAYLVRDGRVEAVTPIAARGKTE